MARPAASTSAGAFTGVRVLEYTRGSAGAIAARYLGDYGADVLCVGGAGQSEEQTPLEVLAGRNKRVVDVDPRTDGGAERVRALAEQADVVVTDWTASELRSVGLDADTLRGEHRDLVFAWLPPHTAAGPMTELPPDDLLLAAWTGTADQQPGGGGGPLATDVPIFAYEQGALAATAIAAALVSRARTGAGRTVTVTGLHADAALNITLKVDMPGIIRPFGTATDGTGTSPQYRLYQCGDGEWLFMGTITAGFFFGALEVMDAIELMVAPGVDGEFSNLRLPSAQRTVGGAIAARLAERPRAEWLELFAAAGLPVAPVQTRAQWRESGTVHANQLLVTIDHPQLGAVEMPGLPVRLGRTPGRIAFSPDRPGPAGAFVARSSGEERRPVPPINDPGAPPLAGVRVIDLSRFLAGPFTGTLLEAFGAEVVKIEAPGGEEYRDVGAASYIALNRGKYQVALDLHKSEQRSELMSILASADVVIENMRPGVPERLGVGYETTNAVNPALVHCHLSAWGDGPLREAPGFDPLLQAYGGVMQALGDGTVPVMMAVPVHDVGSGTLAAFGVVAALYERTRSGAGQFVQTSLAASSVEFQAGEFTRRAGQAFHDAEPRNVLGPYPWQRYYECADGWVAISTTRELLAGYSSTSGAGDDELGCALAGFCGSHSVADVLAAMAGADITAARVLRKDEVFHRPELVDSGYFFSVEDSEFGPVQVPRAFAEFAGVPLPESSWCHLAGEDSISSIDAGR